MIDPNRFYCEGQAPGLPDGWDAARADWDTRLTMAALDTSGDALAALDADQTFARENGHHVVAAGFVGTWPIDPDILSDEDAFGGVRIGYPGAGDPYTCAACGSPVRFIP